MSLDIQSVDLVSTLRTAPENGAPSSADYNDTLRELLADLGSLAEAINVSILPVLNTLPEGAGTGLEGRTIFASLDSDKSPLFYSSAASKFLTVAEVMSNLYQLISQSNSQLVDMMARITSLQSKLATTSHNDVINAVQSFTDQVRQVSYTLSSISQIVANHTATLSKTQAVRTPLQLTADEERSVDVTWPVAYADNSYTVAITVEGAEVAIKNWIKRDNGVGITVIVSNRVSALNPVTLHTVVRAD